MSIRIKNAWLQEHDGAYLYWVSSPWRGDSDNMVTCVFRADSESKPIFRPWGELPLLRMGYLYKDGMPVSLRSDCSSFLFTSSQIKRAEFKTARDCLPAKDYPLNPYHSPALYDQCLVCYTEREIYVIPCVEIVRAVAGVSSFLINRLLSGSSLSDYASIEEEDHKINFSPYSSGNAYPAAMRKPDLIIEYVNFCCQPEMANWWKSIQNAYLAFSTDRQYRIKTGFPKSSSLVIRGHGYRFGSIVFLPSIELANLPIVKKEISFDNPSEKSANDPSKPGQTILRDESPNKDLGIDGGSKNSSISESIPINGDRFSFRPKIIHVSRGNGESRNRTKTIPQEKESITVSMEDVLPGSSLPHFETVPDVCDDPTPPLDSKPGFHSICKAIDRLHQQGVIHDVKLKYDVRTYHYAVFTGITRSGSFLILEFSEQAPPISTLIVKRENGVLNGGEADHILSRFLSSWESAGRHWLRPSLDRLGIPYQLLRHNTNRSSLRLAQLLQDKLRS